MNIVYLSHVTNVISQGPNYSVPAQINAQSEYDNVFWWNLTEAKQDFWLETGLFHGIDEYNVKEISSLPAPFNKPDLVVFESLYYWDDIIFAKQCKKSHIPYVVVPRSALTKQGQSQKHLKKLIGNTLFFKKVIKNAAAIHYLTQKEYKDSGSIWNKRYFVVPNGFESKYNKQRTFNVSKKIKGLYIGRFDPYQKGLDLLVEACLIIKEEMIRNGMVIELYGPERQGLKKEYQTKIKDLGLDSVLHIMNQEGIFGEEKERVINNSDFFIHTSRFEGMPMAVIEALCCGLPCVVTTGTNMAEAIENNKAGVGCKTNTASISEAIKRVIKDKSLLSDYSRNALRLGSEYNWDKIAHQTHAEYEKILRRLK